MAIILKKRGSPYGIKVPENKFSEKQKIKVMPLPERLVIPLQQNIGAPCQSLVKKGERVLAGQKIGDSDKFVSAPIHATTSGEVTGTTTVVNPPTGALVEAIVIAPDGEDKWVELEAVTDWEKLDVKDILGRIREAGLVGMGGATFPTHIKLAPPKGKEIDTVILNGCECEPYVTADHRLMLEAGEAVLSGLAIISKVLVPKQVFIAIEDNKEDAIEHIAKLIKKAGYDFQVAPLKSKYPMGAEKTLIDLILHREVPIGGLPLEVGVVVQNVSTAKAVHDAVIEGKPLIERVVTVTGEVKKPQNLLVRFGVPIGKLIEHCGGMKPRANKVILGGPMMGITQFELDFPVIKGTNSLLITRSTTIEERDCISCGKCIEVCPMRLMPTLLARNAKTGNYDICKENYIDDCFECGSCTYTCPANIPIVQYIKVAKKELMKRAKK